MLGPRHTAADVAAVLERGLLDGTIVLDGSVELATSDDRLAELQKMIDSVLMQEDTRIQSVLLLGYIYAGLIAGTVLIILLEGWHLGGFSLDPKLLQWLGAAVVAEVAGVSTLIISRLFRNDPRRRSVNGGSETERSHSVLHDKKT